MSDDFAADDQLRAMLSDLDPMSARVPVDPPTSPRARHQLEQVMSQGIEITESTTTAKRSFRGKTWLAAAAAIAAVAVGTTVAVTAGEDGGGKPAVVAAPTVTELKPSGQDPMTAMCLMFDVNTLKQAGIAFGGTVTSIGDGKVTLKADRWFKGNPTDNVTIEVPPGLDTAALDGVSFEMGKRFLISATDGVMGGCGYSGPADASYEKQFEQAFPGA